MKKYFAIRQSINLGSPISSLQIASYKERLVIEMKDMGATEQELTLIHDTIIKNSIQNKREPRDVAWAILQ